MSYVLLGSGRSNLLRRDYNVKRQRATGLYTGMDKISGRRHKVTTCFGRLEFWSVPLCAHIPCRRPPSRNPLLLYKIDDGERKATSNTIKQRRAETPHAARRPLYIQRKPLLSVPFIYTRIQFYSVFVVIPRFNHDVVRSFVHRLTESNM